MKNQNQIQAPEVFTPLSSSCYNQAQDEWRPSGSGEIVKPKS